MLVSLTKLLISYLALIIGIACLLCVCDERSSNMVIVSSWKFSVMLTFFTDNFKNNNGLSLSTTSIVTISGLWLPIMTRILAECMESIFPPSPNLYMLLDCPKETFCWSSSRRLLTYWVSHSFLHTVLLAPQSKAELHVSDVKFWSSFC